MANVARMWQIARRVPGLIAVRGARAVPGKGVLGGETLIGAAKRAGQMTSFPRSNFSDGPASRVETADFTDSLGMPVDYVSIREVIRLSHVPVVVEFHEGGSPLGNPELKKAVASANGRLAYARFDMSSPKNRAFAIERYNVPTPDTAVTFFKDAERARFKANAKPSEIAETLRVSAWLLWD